MRSQEDKDIFSVPDDSQKEGDRSTRVLSRRGGLAVLLAMLSLGPTSCAAPAVTPTDSIEMGKGVGKAPDLSPKTEKGSKTEGGSDDEDELEDPMLEGMDEVEKCLDITLGDEVRAWDPSYMGKKRVLSKRKVGMRCDQI